MNSLDYSRQAWEQQGGDSKVIKTVIIMKNYVRNDLKADWN